MTPEQRLRAVKRALEHAESLGVTSVQDIGADLRRHRGLRRSREPRRADGPRLRAAAGRRLVRSGEARPASRVRIAVAARSARCARHLAIAAATPTRSQTRLMAADHAGLQLSVEPPATTRCAPERWICSTTSRAPTAAAIAASASTSRRCSRRSWIASRRLNAIAYAPAGTPSAPSLRPLIDKGVRVALGSGWPVAPLNPMLDARRGDRAAS